MAIVVYFLKTLSIFYFLFFLNVGPPFLPPSMVYISVINTQTLQITFLHDIDLLWAAFHIFQLFKINTLTFCNKLDFDN